jgi:hypothetical protein
MKTLRNSSIITLAIVALALLAAPMANANTINGSIGLNGNSLGGTPSSPSWTGTTFTLPEFGGQSLATVASDSGTFSYLGADTVVVTPSIGAYPSGFTLTLSDPGEFSFVSTGAFTIEHDSGNSLVLTGLGTVTDNVLDTSPAAVTFSLQDSNNDYGMNGGATWTIDLTAPPPPPPGVPEPGTLSLFGTGMLGLAGMLRRKFAKS